MKSRDAGFERFLPGASGMPSDSRSRNIELFERAYCGEHGQFAEVLRRLDMQQSVLVIMPGELSRAAAQWISRAANAFEWRQFGLLEGDKSAFDVWPGSGEMLRRQLNWCQREEGPRPGAIFHGLDHLAAACPHPSALNAVFNIQQTIREGGLVLGLADANSDPLTDLIVQDFHATIQLNVSSEAFPSLIPRELAQKIHEELGSVPQVTIAALSRKFRGHSPALAVRIMEASTQSNQDIESVFDSIRRVTTGSAFIDPRSPDHGYPDHIVGFPKEIIERVTNEVIEPWKKAFSVTCRSSNDDKSLVNGCVFFGPPGTGKTYLTKYIARQIDLPTRLISAADIKDKYFGGSEVNMHRLFQGELRPGAPCVLILDDGDDLAVDRSRATGSTAGAEKGIVHAFLQELDGIFGSSEGILVFLTTNQMGLDPAFLRRFDLQIPVPYPPDRSTVAEIVDEWAGLLGLGFESKCVRENTIDRFMMPVVRKATASQPILTSDDRRRAVSNLFGPSEIKNGMRLMAREVARNGGIAFTEFSLALMEGYYESLANQP